jgi:D-3-phosphoglycerate dehydrogenase
MRIVAVGDSFMPPHYFEEAFVTLAAEHEVDCFQVDRDWPFVPETESELRLKEYQGSPAELIEHMPGTEVLVVHGAPVTDAVLDASTALRLVGCARGGPVNVDVEAATARGLPVVTSPAKNAEAVADQTLAFLVMVARGFPQAQRFLHDGHQLKDNWEGARFIGSDLRRHTLGLVGYGQIGRRVAARALPFGLTVLVYDPLLEPVDEEAVEWVDTLEELLERSDFVSLHARASTENTHMFDEAAFAQMRPGSFLINTARETLVDEDALDAALASGHLAGAALDVVGPTSDEGRHRLLRHENVVMTPHIGGATHETLLQGTEMMAAEIQRFAAGEPLLNVFNKAVVNA